MAAAPCGIDDGGYQPARIKCRARKERTVQTAQQLRGTGLCLGPPARRRSEAPSGAAAILAGQGATGLHPERGSAGCTQHAGAVA